MTFQDLGFNDNILKAITECGYETPTPIQAEAIPHVLMGRDVIGLAQTGTGKTASFTLPMIEILDGGRARARMPRSLILSPTRELAAQIAENFETYGKYTNLSMALLTGGVSMGDQIKKLDRGVDVLIATPGRLLDLFGRGKILLTGIKIFVVDEADRMMDMGFIPDIEKIVGLLSPMRQTLLFSATMPPTIKKLTAKFQDNPRTVSVAAVSSASERVEQFVVKVSPRGKRPALIKLLNSEDVGQAFIFCNRKRDIDGLTKVLQGKGFKADALHGDMDQSSRTRTLEAFKNQDIDLLVCSDVAGRGIDVNDLSHVFNYDVPFNAEDYIHRIGRTGRAGKEGRAFMMVTDNDDKFFDAIEKLTGKTIDVYDVDGGKKDAKSSGNKRTQSNTKNAPRSKSQSNDQQGEQKNARPKRTRQRSSAKKNDNENAPRDARKTSNDDRAVKSKDRQSQKDESNEKSVVGFGDDVPAFLSGG